MDIVQAFIKDQFHDDDDFEDNTFTGRRGANGKRETREDREVQNLKKELEELKFYQELERTEYEDMKMKMYNIEKKGGKSSGKKPSRNAVTTETSVDIFDSISDTQDTEDSGERNSKALAKKNAEIEKLKDQLQMYTGSHKFVGKGIDPKEFGKRMAKLEKAKNGEIDEIKEHYKGLMENLAKQIQKSNERYDAEINKNTELRTRMEEMRKDMAAREQELEDKLIQMEAIVRKSEQRATKLNAKLEKTEANLASKQLKYREAVQEKEERVQKIKYLEADFEEERKELKQHYEDEKDEALRLKNGKIDTLEDEVEALRERVSIIADKLDVEERSHEETVVELKKAQAEMIVMQDDNFVLEKKADEAENESRLHRLQAQKEVEKVSEDSSRMLGFTNEKMNKITDDKINLTQELNSVTQQLNAAEKKIEFMQSNSIQKGGALRRKDHELEQLQLELRELCDRHMKDLKARDLGAIRDQKKAHAIETTLKKELSEIKFSAAYIKAQGSESPDNIPDNATIDDLKNMVQNLRAQKASMSLQMAATKDRSKRDIGQLEKKLKDAGQPAASKNQPMKSMGRRTITFSASPNSGVSSPSARVNTAPSTHSFKNQTPQPDDTHDTTHAVPSKPSQIELDHDDDSVSDVSATTGRGSKMTRKMSHSVSYRRQLRTRRSIRLKKATEPSIE